MRHRRHGPPREVLAAAILALRARGLRVEGSSDLIRSAPLGPSRRRYANGVVVVATDFEPPVLLVVLKQIEADFGRRRGGARWRGRVLDLDIILWSGGCWNGATLSVPHMAFRTRTFVLRPALQAASAWRDPIGGLTVRQLHTRLTRPTPLP